MRLIIERKDSSAVSLPAKAGQGNSGSESLRIIYIFLQKEAGISPHL